jgi:pentose-5-phosphate-3-epimerase
MEIIHAVMPYEYDDIAEHAQSVKGAISTLQIDIMDGQFVPEATWPFEKKAEPTGHIWEALQNQDEGLPLWEHVDYELDLMVKEPERWFDEWVMLGPKRIIFHLESLKDPVATLQKAQGIRSVIEVGLAIDNNTSLDELIPHLEVIDCVQIMGIKKVGFQGEATTDI